MRTDINADKEQTPAIATDNDKIVGGKNAAWCTEKYFRQVKMKRSRKIRTLEQDIFLYNNLVSYTLTQKIRKVH